MTIALVVSVPVPIAESAPVSVVWSFSMSFVRLWVAQLTVMPSIEAAIVLTIFVEATPSQNRQFSCDELQMLD